MAVHPILILGPIVVEWERKEGMMNVIEQVSMISVTGVLLPETKGIPKALDSSSS